jgi:Arm DNA-binding domain
MQLRTGKPEITAKNYLAVGPGEYPCGNNLYLIVTPSGGRRWAFRYQRNGIVKKMGLGSAKETGLKLSEAKDKAIDALRLLSKGSDPREYRDDEKRRSLRNGKTELFRRRSEHRFAFFHPHLSFHLG